MGAYGLQTYIWNNNWKSILLLAGFPVLLLLLIYGLFLLFAGLSGVGGDSVSAPFVWAAHGLAAAWPFALIGAAIWFAIAYFANQTLIDLSTGARRVARRDEPRLYNLLENLCISRGITTPALRIIESEAMNAFASGLNEKQYSVTVTRGLMQALDDAELEAVLAHELTHIRNRDVRLLVIAVIFVGIFSFVGEMVFRGMVYGGSGRSRRSRGGGGGALLAILIAFAIMAIAYALAVAIRFALSRRREFMADAGAVELTKNPDAMISALRKISGNAALPHAPAEVKEMMFENPHVGFGDLFATHPPIAQRIRALMQFAGGVDAPVASPPPSGPWGDPATPAAGPAAGPWGAAS